MTHDEIAAIPLGKVLDQTVAASVLGWQRVDRIQMGNVTTTDAWVLRHPDGYTLVLPVSETPKLSEDKRESYIVVDAMLRRGKACYIRLVSLGTPAVPPTEENPEGVPATPDVWEAAFRPGAFAAPDADAIFQAPTAQEAVARAALWAVQ